MVSGLAGFGVPYGGAGAHRRQGSAALCISLDMIHLTYRGETVQGYYFHTIPVWSIMTGFTMELAGMHVTKITVLHAVVLIL